MATSNWDPGLTSGVPSDNPNSTDTDGIDVNPGFTVSVISPYRSPWSELTDSDVWLPGSYKGNGFILTSLPYPIMERDSYTVTYVLKPSVMLGEVRDSYRQAGLTFLGGSIAGILVTLPTQPSEQYRELGITAFLGGSLTSIVVSLPSQPSEQYRELGVVFTSGGSLTVIVVSMPTQPSDSYRELGVTFISGSLV